MDAKFSKFENHAGNVTGRFENHVAQTSSGINQIKNDGIGQIDQILMLSPGNNKYFSIRY